MLDAKKLGLSAGIVVGLLMFLITLISVYTGFGREILKLYPSVWYGYEISIIGAFIGLVYGFIKGFVLFYLIGFVYNKL